MSLDKNTTRQIKVRMAPSPTGKLHLGTARVAAFNWLFARHHEAPFVLRIEDTDKERSTREFEQNIIDGLKWLGMSWDEFYRQSDRTQIYSKYLEKLLENGKAFWCYHTPEELKAESDRQMANKELPRHVCEFKKFDGADGRKFKSSYSSGVIRLALNENSDRKIIFKDIIRGEVKFEERLLGDISIARNIKDPLYHFTVVVDDYEMNISHIIRGEDHISNTPKHIMIQEALGFYTPEYVHLPLVLDAERKKLSKRAGAVSVDDYMEAGYLPEALFNYIITLGYTPKNDTMIASKEELVKNFDLTKIHKSGAIYDTDKLNFVNGEYLKQLSNEDFKIYIRPLFIKKNGAEDEALLSRFCTMIRDRFRLYEDIEEYKYIFSSPEYESELLLWKESSKEDTFYRLSVVYDAFKDFAEWDDKTKIKNALEAKVEELNIGRGPLYWPFRVSLSGLKNSPDPVELAYVLGRDTVLGRVKSALDKLK